MRFWPWNKTIIVLLIPLLPGVWFSRPLLADTRYPVVPNSEIDVPFCYLQTTDGRTIDLGILCGPKAPAPNSDKSCNSKVTVADLPIANVNYNGEILTGQVTNQTCKTLKNLKVNYEVLDESGNAIDNGFIAAQPSNVPPGGSASFRGMVSKGAKAQATHVDWSD